MADGISDEVENLIAQWARSGALGAGAREAVRKRLARGGSVTQLRGSRIVRIYGDGREEKIGEVETSRYELPGGVEIIEP